MWKELVKLFASQKTARPLRRLQCRPLQVQQLEDRRVMTNYLLLDWSPDNIQGELTRGGFEEAFDIVRNANGLAPAFLDYDGNRLIEQSDISSMAVGVRERVQQLLAGYPVEVIDGDFLQQSNWGLNGLLWGMDRPQDNVFTMYVGGWSGKDTQAFSTFGEAFQPPVGYVNEYYAMTYPTSIANWMNNGNPNATAQDFINKNAQTIVHEFGHLLGVGHVWGNAEGDANLMNYSADPATSYLPNAEYPFIELHDGQNNEYWGRQNPALEAWNSLSYEPVYTGYFGRVYRSENPHGDHDQAQRDTLRAKGTELIVSGTGNADSIDVSLGKYVTIEINGESFKLDPTGYKKLSLQAAGGKDFVTVQGTDLAESLIIKPLSATLTSGALQVVVSNAENMTWNLGNGTDSVTMYDSVGNDTFSVRPGFAEMKGPNYRNVVNNAEQVSAIASSGNDIANIRDSAFADLLETTRESVTLRTTDRQSPMYSIMAKGFDSVKATSEPTKGVVDRVKRFKATDLVFKLEQRGNWKVI